MCPLLADLPSATRAVLGTKLPNTTLQNPLGPEELHPRQSPQDEAKLHSHKCLMGPSPEPQYSNSVLPCTPSASSALGLPKSIHTSLTAPS